MQTILSPFARYGNIHIAHRNNLTLAQINMPDQTPPHETTASCERYTFTIFIPTYNRAYVLGRALESVEQLKYHDFEVVIVDDGSTDNTRALVESWIGKHTFPIQYHWQENQGKHAAHNAALQLARGEFFLTLDSDDRILPNALNIINHHWNAIPADQRDQFAGIAGLCLKDDGSLSGTPYPDHMHDASYLDMANLRSLRGEKRQAIRTAILREFPYPRIEGEKHVRPSLILKRMAHDYKLRFVNEPLEINIHETDGICANRHKYRMNNPKGLRLYFLEDITLHASYATPKKLARSYRGYVRYSLHSGVGLAQQAREIKHMRLWLYAIADGTLCWLTDKLKMKFAKRR